MTYPHDVILDPHATPAPARAGRSADRQWVGDSIWIFAFLFVEILTQLLLLIPQAAALRVPLRIAPFGCSLAFLILFPKRAEQRVHPAVWWLGSAMFIIAAGVAHPDTATLAGAMASIAQSLAIAAPVLWVCSFRVNARGFRAIILIVWSFAALSSLVGVLQTLRPDWTILQPNLSTVIQNFNDGGEGLKISLTNGTQVFRPMGLSDQPGGAASAGMTTVVFGIALFATYRNRWLRAVIVAGMILGLDCLLLTQVRSLLIMSGVCVMALVAVVSWRGELARISTALIALAAVIFIGAGWAIAIAGETVTSRLSTLVEDDPRTVYYTNRGYFLEETIYHTIPSFPLGAGLGRWGMINYYFGADSAIESLWAEIMWTAWVYDGGIPLVLAYATAIGIAVWQSWKIGTDRAFKNGEIGLCGAMIFAYNIGAFAITFNYPFFGSQMGMDFWLLNGALFIAAQVERSNSNRASGSSRGTDPPRSAPAPRPVRRVPMPRGLTEMGA